MGHLLLVLLVFSTFLVPYDSRIIRKKRQSLPDPYRPILLPADPGYQPYNYPINGVPFQPTHPGQHHYGFGLTRSTGLLSDTVGHMRFPMINKNTRTYVPFRLEGKIGDTGQRPYLEYGHSFNPVEPFGINYESVYTCLLSPFDCTLPPSEIGLAAAQRPQFLDVPRTPFGDTTKTYGPQFGPALPPIGFIPTVQQDPAALNAIRNNPGLALNRLSLKDKLTRRRQRTR